MVDVAGGPAPPVASTRSPEALSMLPARDSSSVRQAADRGERSRRPFATALLLASLLGSSCAREPSPSRGEAHAREQAASATTITVQRVLPYPRGRWRLAAREELDRTVLWFSQILIRYDGVLDANVSFSLAEWSSVYPSSRLSREDALRRARDIADQARTGTVAFAELVKTHTEDLVTIGRAGWLGGMTASMLDEWGQILDALEVLRPGQTSEVVETPYGFHILQRRAPPPEQTVSGAHIVIAHDQAPTFRGYLLRGNSPHRSRAEAEALARQIYERARLNSAAFTELQAALSNQGIGELSTTPVRTISSFALLRRLDPELVARPPAAALELPTHATPNRLVEQAVLEPLP